MNPSRRQRPYDLPEQYQRARLEDPPTTPERRPLRSKRPRRRRGAATSEPNGSAAAKDTRVSRRAVLRVGSLAGTAGLLAAGTWKLSQGDPFGAQHASAGAGTTLPSTTPTTTVPAVTDVYARWVQDENALPGTADWNIGSLGDQHAIEGFFDTTSAANGDTVQLFVSTTASTFHVEAYRMGWYQGLGARLVWSSPETPGRVQPTPTVARQTNMVDTAWQQPLPIDITDNYVPGCYLFKLVSSDGRGRYVPLTIRDANNPSAFLIMNAVTTWQAYNQWGGYSLYWGAVRGGQTFANRARVVSFDRPYEVNGAPQFLAIELPLIHLVERLGLDVSYATNVDVHRSPSSVLSHKALVSLGHDEYYSTPMRGALEGARDQGINLAFLGANAVFRQIRYDDSPLGPNRREICYKSAAEDPLSRTNPALTTVNWRDAPLNRPENQLIGSQYESNPVQADMVIAEPDSWVFANTGLQAGATLPGVVAGEYDRYYTGPGVPQNVDVLAHSPLVCRGKASYADMTYYSAPSGAGVFDVGTQAWVQSLGAPSQVQGVIDITTNLLTTFGRGPAGTTHPSQTTNQLTGPAGSTGSE
jgi:hypothetical protein